MLACACRGSVRAQSPSLLSPPPRLPSPPFPLPSLRLPRALRPQVPSSVGLATCVRMCGVRCAAAATSAVELEAPVPAVLCGCGRPLLCAVPHPAGHFGGGRVHQPRAVLPDKGVVFPKSFPRSFPKLTRTLAHTHLTHASHTCTCTRTRACVHTPTFPPSFPLALSRPASMNGGAMGVCYSTTLPHRGCRCLDRA
jgi:hypothetical protein